MDSSFASQSRRPWSSTPSSRGGAESGTLLLATRLQQLAQNHAAAKTKLQEEKDLLAQAHASKTQAIEAHRAQRRLQLEHTISQSQAELDLFDAQDAVKEQKAQNHEIHARTQAIKDQSEQVEQKFQQDVETLYAPHEMEMEGYRDVLETKIRKQQKLHDQLSKLNSDISRLKHSEEKLGQDRLALEQACEALKVEEASGLEQVADLAKQVRITLSQRTDLKKALREAKEELRNKENVFANDG